MTVFISHSFENKPEFENIVDALNQRSISYWNPSEVKAGASLREQLRTAVDRWPLVNRLAIFAEPRRDVHRVAEIERPASCFIVVRPR